MDLHIVQIYLHIGSMKIMYIGKKNILFFGLFWTCKLGKVELVRAIRRKIKIGASWEDEVRGDTWNGVRLQVVHFKIDKLPFCIIKQENEHDVALRLSAKLNW